MFFPDNPELDAVFRLMRRRLRAKTEKQRQQADVALGEASKPSVCLYWRCEKPPRTKHALCERHHGQLQQGLIDECPKCGQAKDTRYSVCARCYDNQPRRSSKAPARQRYASEHAESWAKGDAAADHFFVYILKLDEGKFYAGQTRELRERLSEHRDGQTRSTAGKNPKLVWYGMLPTREQAATREAELKKLIDSNPREIRRMVIRFRDLVQELDYT